MCQGSSKPASGSWCTIKIQNTEKLLYGLFQQKYKD
jgi:hypothetical protein